MDLGNKIYSLRKQKGLSQEQVAQELGITRQTVSNWETNTTKPDVEQAKLLSKCFNISLDELVGNDVQHIIIDKVSNTERLAGFIIKILKFIGIFMVGSFILIILSILLFSVLRKSDSITMSAITQLYCSTDNEDYTYLIEYDERNKKILETEVDFTLDDIDIESYLYVDDLLEAIDEYFENNNGSCTVK